MTNRYIKDVWVKESVRLTVRTPNKSYLGKYLVKWIVICASLLHAKMVCCQDENKFNLIKSISYENNEQFLDFKFLDTVLLNKSIVILGEETHLDGATDDLKNRTITYLHEHLGFNVLIGEISAFAANDFYCLIKGTQPIDSLLATDFNNFPGFYTTSDFNKFSYIRHQASLPHTELSYTGMDLIFAGDNTLNKFYDYLSQEFLYYNFIESGKDVRFMRMIDLYSKILRKPQKSESNYRQFSNEALYFQHLIDDKELKLTSDEYRLVLLKRHLKDYVNGINYQRKVYHIANATSLGKRPATLQEDAFLLSLGRDSLMFANVKYLKEKYKGEKIIIDCSNKHSSTSNFSNAICEDSLAKLFKNSFSLGYYLRKEYGSQLYSIATICYEGSYWSTTRDGIETFNPIEKRSDQTLEFKLAGMGDFGFLDLHQYSNDNNIKCYKMFPTFSKELNAKWSDIYDGIFFIKKMYPHTRVFTN